MSIIIHFSTTSFIPSSIVLPSMHSYVSKTQKKITMVPGIDETDQTVMTDDENSMVDIATSNTLYTHTISLKNSNHVFGSCFGLPYQDHNYGAPPPPTPPNHSPCASPAHANGIPDEDTNLSIVSASTTNEEIQGSSITRCICGFEHDDEYMICCDHCLVWQHVDCMGLDRNNIPETYLCEKCKPRKVDRHKAKVLQTRKKVAMTDSSDSDEDTNIKNADRKQKNRKRKRREEEKNDEKFDQLHRRKSRQLHKHAKERIEAKRSRLRRTKNKESTSTADEEAQDAWESSLEWCEKNFETAMSNQYTPEVQLLAKDLPKLGHEERLMELLLTRNCKVIDGNQKKLISIYDIPRDQPLVEFKGKFLLASQFYDLHPAFSKRLFPYVMFYSLGKEDICVDASVYGNEARFIRRSCKPNAELRHLVQNGNLHLYISSTKAVFKDDEITLPLDFASLKEGIKDIECACESHDCLIKLHPKNGNVDISHEKRRKGKKIFLSADDDSSHSFQGSNASPTKCKSIIKNNSQSNEATEGKYETEEQANERKKKTREERKLDAIMRAFDQMEKAAKRRQQALERQKAHHPKTEEVSEKSESTTSKDDDKATTASGSETQGGEEEKPHIPTPKPKKGKRRRGSGTQARRRTRTNSGGSDILSPEENILPKSIQVSTADQTSNHDSYIEPACVVVTIASTNSVSSTSTTASGCPVSPVVLKTKRLLLNEWLQEKSETNPPTTSAVSVRTEVKWNTTTPSTSTCYVQCTKDNPHSGGISAAHLRRISSSSQIKPLPLKSCSEQGFTKKRWLRQAMFDCNSYDEPLTIDPGSIEGYPFDHCYLSPTSHGEMGSPGAVDDTVTPLKKRRLLRESVESVSSPLSPTVFSSDGLVDVSQHSNNDLVKLETEVEGSDELLLLLKTDSLKLQSVPEEKSCKINGLNLSEELSRDPSIKEEFSNSENDPSILIEAKCEVPDETVNLTTSLDCNKVEISMQMNCDLENKVCDCIEINNAEEDVLTMQTNCEFNSDNASNIITASVDLCTEKQLQSNNETETRITDILDNVKNKKISEDHSAKQSCVVSSDESCSQCNTLENCSCSQKSIGLEIKNNVSITHSDTIKVTSDEDVNQTQSEFKLSENVIDNVLNEDSSVVPVTYERAKDTSTNLISSCPDKDSSVILVEQTDVSVSASSDYNSDIEGCNIIVPKNTLTDTSIVESEFLCGNVLSDDVNVNVKSSEISYLDLNSCQLSSENSSLVSTASASATQKRKVSLSEYRLRMKDGFNKRINSEKAKTNATTPATAIPETLPEKVTLAPLPLFNTAAISKSPPETPLKAPKLKKGLTENDKKESKECYIDILEPRENLTERLKREFGFDDESEGIPPAFNNQFKPISTNTSAIPLRAQPSPSPPPPPPPPRPVKSSQINMNVAPVSLSSQFGFTMQTSYARPSYIVPQVPSAQFIPVQQTVNIPVLSSVHPISAPVVQPSLLPSPHPFAPSLSGTVLQSSIQQEFSSVNAQNYAALVQQPCLPQPQKTYPHVCQQSLYK